ncbi:MAG: efflux RND transporter periplasmic adaptor subunit [Deltaproteobacteria bacterium]|jgi:HlyD family secretion protein|nr:efflux RND transporter periplasmic adaptor subunit [Deltaproteobacteria bacterium]
MGRHSFRWFILVLLIVLAGGLVWYKTRPKEVEVTVAQAVRGKVEKIVANTRAGTLNACRKANLSPGTGGQISLLDVEEGDSVKEGQLLMELWNKDLKAEAILVESQVTAAKAKAAAAKLQAEIAGREAERMQQLIRDNAISEQDADKIVTEAKVKQVGYEAAITDMKAIQSRLGVLKAQLDRTRLVAPFDGIIAKITGELNEYVTPSPPGIPTPPAIELLDTSCFYVTAPIDEVDAPAVKINMDARVIMDAFGDRYFAGRVRRIDPFVLDLEKQARTVDVEVEFVVPEDTKDFLAGYSADVEIIVEVADDVLRIPTQALLDNNKVYVYLPQSRTLQERIVRTGLSNWDNTQVVDGLQEGDTVVVSTDKPGLKDGVRGKIFDE